MPFDMPFIYSRLSVLSAAAGDGLFGDAMWIKKNRLRYKASSSSSSSSVGAASSSSSVLSSSLSSSSMETALVNANANANANARGTVEKEETRKRSWNLSFTHRRDQVSIRYKFKRPTPDFRKDGMNIRARKINETRDELRARGGKDGGGKGGGGNGNGDDDDDDDDDDSDSDCGRDRNRNSSDDDNDNDDDDDNNNNTALRLAVSGRDETEFVPISYAQTTGVPLPPPYPPLPHVAGSIASSSGTVRTTMMTTTTRTFTHGTVDDLQVAYAYCMMDVIITMMLLRVKKTELSYMADTTISGIQPRELYTSEMVKSTVNTMYQYGYWENILTPDVTHERDEHHIWTPGYDFKAERDMCLRPLGGRTVQSNGVYVEHPIACLDFASQYPSIMRSHNIGLSSLLRNSDIEREALIEGVDYTKIWVENVRPIVEHACKHNCDTGVGGKGDPSKCVASVTFMRTGMDVNFATKTRLEAVVAQSSTDLASQRMHYKKIDRWPNCTT